jgi:hypothetical protein
VVENSVAEHDSSVYSDNDNRDRWGGGQLVHEDSYGGDGPEGSAVLKKDMQSALHW